MAARVKRMVRLFMARSRTRSRCFGAKVKAPPPFIKAAPPWGKEPEMHEVFPGHTAWHLHEAQMAPRSVAAPAAITQRSQINLRARPQIIESSFDRVRYG